MSNWNTHHPIEIKQGITGSGFLRDIVSLKASCSVTVDQLLIEARETCCIFTVHVVYPKLLVVTKSLGGGSIPHKRFCSNLVVPNVPALVAQAIDLLTIVLKKCINVRQGVKIKGPYKEFFTKKEILKRVAELTKDYYFWDKSYYILVTVIDWRPHGTI